ncbi:hypothetical protein [Sphingomonas sp. SFZ2018-12]|nr:hypothetical protein [Sphingomonas sp. SFZ2018-12]
MEEGNARVAADKASGNPFNRFVLIFNEYPRSRANRRWRFKIASAIDVG